MARVRVGGFSISLDGFGAGPEQSLRDPLGRRGQDLHQWLFGTRFFRTMTGQEGGSEGTTFIFVTGGIEAALEQARAAAGDLDVKIGGGVATVRQYLRAGLIDELHVAVSPVVLGQGEAMFGGIDLPALGYRVTEHQASEHATHIVLAK
jgi:dihydrofolate reductase